MNKKNISFVITFIIMFIISINGVDAISCSYGYRDGDDASTWTKKIQFEIQNWNVVKMNIPESPLMEDFGFEEGSECDEQEQECDYMGGKDMSVADYFFYYKIFMNEEMYKAQNGECPKILRVKAYVESNLVDANIHVGFYNDDLDVPTMEASWIHFEYGADPVETIYILEKYKNEKLEELVDPYSCHTYFTFLKALEKDRDNSPSKSCDNNAEFNQHYQQLQNLCNNYRATSMYATTEENEPKATACNKACSMLKDDIAEMCQAKPSGGYCGSLGNKIVNWIFKIVRIVRYVIPILLILLSILDYIKAIAADSEDEMKKASGRFAKRLIVSALIFLVPFVLDFLLRIFDIPGLNSSNPFCAK